MTALARLMTELTAQSSHTGTPTSRPDYALVTVTHVQMGAPAFGVAPGKARLFATLRTLTNDRMSALVETVERLARDVAEAEGLRLEIGYSDVFVTCENDPEAVAIVRAALDDLGVPHGPGDLPLRGSEDFGHFGHGARAALLMLGAGDMPALHNPDYDFPDELIPQGAAIFSAILNRIMQSPAKPGAPHL